MKRYDPFVTGKSPVEVRTIEALDRDRNRLFQIEIWYPASAQPGSYPLIIFSHPSGGSRKGATFLTSHLSSHGYVVAALDHSEVIVPELRRKPDESETQKKARIEALIQSRVPDVQFLIHHLLNESPELDSTRVGIVGHSFGGWTALAAIDVEPRIQAAVALAPGGASRRKPGIIPGTLTFNWGRDVPTLYLVAENDVSLPLDGMYELFERTPATKQMVILRRADHMHFMDHVEEMHEAVRKMDFPAELAWLPKEMRPIEELCSGAQAHLFIRGLTLAHFDARLKGNQNALQFLQGDLQAELASRGVDVIVHS